MWVGGWLLKERESEGERERERERELERERERELSRGPRCIDISIDK